MVHSFTFNSLMSLHPNFSRYPAEHKQINTNYCDY